MPVSDFTLDALKHIVNPPSRAQLENQDVIHMRKRESPNAPQSGNPISDAVIDTFKFFTNPPSRA